MRSRHENDWELRDLAATSEKILAFFGDHFVSLGGNYIELDSAGRDIGEEKFFAYSGFVIAVRGVWCLVTAAHCIENLEKLLRAGRIRLRSCVLADCFGSKPRVAEPTPVDYEGAACIRVHGESAGLDFALIPIRPLYQMGLEANGIRAISEENWINHDPASCDFFAILGLSECLVPDPTELDTSGGRRAGTVSPTMVWVNPVTLPVDEIPPATFRRFVGRVKSVAPLHGIVGMSGGPIFGFKKTPSGQLHYWIVAVQRWWLRASTTFGCPIRVFAALVEQELERAEKPAPAASE
jgi:hypothetical protein